MALTDGRRGLVAGVVVASAVAVAGVLVGGPILVGAPLWSPPRIPLPIDSRAANQPSEPPRPPSGSAQALVDYTPLVVGTIAVLAICALVVHLIRRYSRRWSPLEDGSGDGILGRTRSDASSGEISPSAVRRGIERALGLLEEPGRPGDAVVRAWLGLEDAAVAAGAARLASETPSEHVTRIVRRFDTDEAAADELRRLYEGVRFGTAPVDADAVETARRSLIRLLDSWTAVGSDERTPR